MPGVHEHHHDLLQTLLAFRAAVNESSIVSITDLDGRIVYVNDRFTKVSGFSASELIGNKHRIINSDYHPDSFFRDMWKTIRNGDRWRGEIRNRRKDGSYYWVDTVITPVRDQEGRIYQYLSVRNLITLQKENEEKLIQMQEAYRKREQQLKDAQEVANTGSWYLDIPANKLEWSEQTYRIFELPIGIPMNFELFMEKVWPEDRAGLEAKWKAAMKTGSYAYEHRIQTNSGLKWVNEKARIEFGPSAEPIAAVGTVIDITDNKRTAQALLDSETLYRNLFNHSPFAIGIMDKETMGFLEVNNTATQVYGYTKEEFRKLTAFDIRVPEEQEKLRDTVQKGLYTKDLSVRPHKRKDGSIILVEPTITEINYKGKAAYLISIVDVTERERMENEISRIRTNRQKEIGRAALKAQEESRAETGRELHDNINQLLVGSTLYLRNVKGASGKDNQHIETARQIITNAIEEIRKLSSAFVPPSLNELSLKDSIGLFINRFKLQNTRLDLDIQIDENKLEQGLKINVYRIIQEQFNNITRHAAAENVKIALLQTDDMLTLEIRDDGKGFDPQQKKHGIGLTNILHRADVYNGKLEIDSSPGQGCRLQVSFPLTGA
ncbi:MAG: PAS domain S-box protein [Chitinophagales bacterium]|nr:PAS domain S-box protein [Chitinophagales bacterium]